MTGTIVCHPYNLGLYHSPHQWHSPRDAVTSRPGEWRRLTDAERDALTDRPGYPGEYIIVEDGKMQ